MFQLCHVSLTSISNVPFAIWLSLLLGGPAVSGWCFSLLCACKPVSAPLGDQLSLAQSAVALHSFVFPVFLAAPVCSVRRAKMAASPLTPGLPAGQMSSIDGCGAAQLQGAGGALEDHVPADLTLGCSLCS